MEMTQEILHVINAVRDYQRFIIHHDSIVKDPNFNWFSKTIDYYYSLPLPDGLETNMEDFNRIINFDPHILQKLNQTNYSDLHYTNWK